MQSLTAWQDIVDPPVLPPALQESGELVIAQEQASAAKFHEIQVKLRQDCEAMTRYHSEKLKVANREHVQRVLHQKSQIAQGKKIVDEFMERQCFHALVGEMGMPHEVDKVVQLMAAKCKVASGSCDVVGWVDLTKIGVLTQKDVNKVGGWCEKLVAKDPIGGLVVNPC